MVLFLFVSRLAPLGADRLPCSYLFFWQFARSGSSVVCNAIPYVSKENFDLKCCYVVLHVYRYGITMMVLRFCRSHLDSLHGKVSPVEKQPGSGPSA
jgi:hypothetical protein